MIKETLIQLLNKYDQGKGILRKLFGDTDGIKKLRSYVTTNLVDKNNSYVLVTKELEEIEKMISIRDSRIYDTDRGYEAAPDKLTNIIYKTLKVRIKAALNAKEKVEVEHCHNQISLVSCEPLTSYVQEELFITTDKYCLVVDEYVEYLKNKSDFLNPYTNSLLYGRRYTTSVSFA